jgi:filamentous hemagglutinin family protein
MMKPKGLSLPAFVSGQYLTNNGTVLSWAPISFTGYLKADGTVPLTGDWANPAYSISALNLTATPTLGDEINTGFASWTAAAGWTYGSGKWTHSSGTTALADTQSAAFDITKKYKITIGYTWAGAASTIYLSAGGVNMPYIASAAETSLTYYLQPTATTRLTIIPTTGFTGSIDSVSIKEVTNGVVISGGFNLNPTQILMPIGTAGHPSISAESFPTTGFYIDASGYIDYAISGSRYGLFNHNGISLYTNSAKLSMGLSLDLVLARDAAAILQLGTDAGTPVAQMLKAHDATGDDVAGASLTIAGGQGTDTGIGGSVKIATAPAGASGSNAGTLVDRVEVDSTGTVKHLGANAQSTNIKQATVVVTTTAAATATATNLIPAGATVIDITTRVTTAVTGDAGFSGFDVGHSGTAIVAADQNAFGDNVTPSVNETTDGTDSTVAGPIKFCTAANVVLTQRGGSTFNAGGVVRITVHYISSTAPST